MSWRGTSVKASDACLLLEHGRRGGPLACRPDRARVRASGLPRVRRSPRRGATASCRRALASLLKSGQSGAGDRRRASTRVAAARAVHGAAGAGRARACATRTTSRIARGPAGAVMTKRTGSTSTPHVGGPYESNPLRRRLPAPRRRARAAPRARSVFGLRRSPGARGPLVRAVCRLRSP